MMLSFKEFLNEQSVATSKRQGIQHFQDMKPIEFINWLNEVKKTHKGILKGIKVNLKVDGGNFKIGKDSNGTPFVEGSRTGPIFDDNAFSRHALSSNKSEEIVTRAFHYDKVAELLKKSKLMKALPNDSKLIFELFYNPMGKDLGNHIQFVTVQYDKAKLGDIITVIPYNCVYASTGQPRPDEQEIISEIEKQSSKDIRVVSPRLGFSGVDLNGIIDPINQFDDEAKRIITSRKKADKEQKSALLQILAQIKQKIYDELLLNPKYLDGLDRICNPDDNEGICLFLPHGTFKMTSQKFQQQHHGS